MPDTNRKPLGRKAYGSIPHLQGSRLGPGDHHAHDGQRRIATEKARDRHDRIIVTEKLDGANVALINLSGRLTGLSRAGYLATTSPYPLHHRFQAWLDVYEETILPVLKDGLVLHAEWLLQTHGVRYVLPHGPLVVFDASRDGCRLPFDHTLTLARQAGLPAVTVVSDGPPTAPAVAWDLLGPQGFHGALAADRPEGLVWRVERRGAFDFITKWVRHDKVDGRFLPDISGRPPLHNTYLNPGDDPHHTIRAFADGATLDTPPGRQPT